VGSLYGYEIESELPLRRLNRARGHRGVIAIRVAGNGLDERAGRITAYLETETGQAIYAGAELPDGHLISFPHSAAFHIKPGVRTIAVAPRGPEAEVEHRLGCSALCTMLALRGDLSLHASAVETPDGAVLFCGPPVHGKSTLAHALGGQGFPVLCEDGAVVELSGGLALALPGPRGVRIRRRSDGIVRSSLVADPGPREPAPSQVAAVTLLEERGAELRVERLAPARALALLTPHLVHTGSEASLAASFARLGSLLHWVPAYRVSLPDDLAALPEISRRLLETLRASPYTRPSK
jgi:hypothetical protein